MLEIRPICENCAKPLPNDSNEAMICTYECTFCKECVNQILENVCPNCGGGFENRPTRPNILLTKDPATTKEHYKPIDKDAFKIKLDKYKNTEPRNR